MKKLKLLKINKTLIGKTIDKAKTKGIIMKVNSFDNTRLVLLVGILKV